MSDAGLKRLLKGGSALGSQILYNSARARRSVAIVTTLVVMIGFGMEAERIPNVAFTWTALLVGLASYVIGLLIACARDPRGKAINLAARRVIESVPQDAGPEHLGRTISLLYNRDRVVREQAWVHFMDAAGKLDESNAPKLSRAELNILHTMLHPEYASRNVPYVPWFVYVLAFCGKPGSIRLLRRVRAVDESFKTYVDQAIQWIEYNRWVAYDNARLLRPALPCDDALLRPAGPALPVNRDICLRPAYDPDIGQDTRHLHTSE